VPQENVDHFLYLTVNEHLLRFASWSFRDLQRRVYFGLVTDWRRQLLDMPAFSWKTKRYVPLKTLLAQSRRGHMRTFSSFGPKQPCRRDGTNSIVTIRILNEMRLNYSPFTQVLPIKRRSSCAIRARFAMHCVQPG